MGLARWVVSPRTLLDIAVGAAVAALSIMALTTGRPGAPGEPASDGRPVRALDVVIAGAVFALIVARRWKPLVVLGVSVTLTVVFATEETAGPFIIATAVATYTVAARFDRRTTWLTCGGAALVSYLAAVVLAGDDWFGPALAIIAWIGMTTAVGDATRNRRAYVAAVEERALRAEQTREEEARRRVAEERLRIARDLHDAVAHHIAVVNLHAGLAGHTLRTRPDQAEASLVHVREAAQTVLDELATILSVLRQNAAYRIVQEALTNAHKHGVDDTADLRVEYRPATIVLEVTNPTGPVARDRDTAGHGLTGMRERATAVGGTLTAEPTGRTLFRVHAVLPAGPS